MLLLRQIGELERNVPRALEGEDGAVHRARVASRRLREALPVMLPPSGRRRKAVRTVRRVTRALGGVREMDVTIHILDELANRPAIPRDALEDVRTHVVAERDRRRQRMLDRLRGVKLAKLERRLDAVASLPPAGEAHAWEDALKPRVVRRAERLAAAIERAGRMYAPESLHLVRIAAKRLRYTLEFAAEARLAAARPIVRILKRAQDTLGRLHDLQIIQHHVAAVLADPPGRYGATDGGLSTIATALEEECRHLHARYSVQVPALLELAAACRTGLFALPKGRPDGRARIAPLKMRTQTARTTAAKLA